MPQLADVKPTKDGVSFLEQNELEELQRMGFKEVEDGGSVALDLLDDGFEEFCIGGSIELRRYENGVWGAQLLLNVESCSEEETIQSSIDCANDEDACACAQQALLSVETALERFLTRLKAAKH